MTDPVTRAFFLGRAFATVLVERAEDTLTDALSDLGRFEAEQRENLRRFTQDVIDRAEREIASGGYRGAHGSGESGSGSRSGDLQETIDELRAEIAHLRAAINAHRAQV